MKILIYADIQPFYLDELIRQMPDEAELLVKSQLSEQEIEDALPDIDILIGNPPANIMKKSGGKIKFWQLENVGFEQYLDLDFKGIVANVGDMSAAACAETIVAGILGFYRGIHTMVQNQLKQQWVGEKIEAELSILGEKQVLILGSGEIAVQTEKLLSAFGCRIQKTARHDPDADIHSYQKVLKTLPQMDLVVNTLPGNLEKYVGKDFLNAMKEGALYANIGRGSTTDEAALIESLESGKLIGAVLDVTEQEPLPANRKLWKMPNVILTQHTGAAHKYRDRDKVAKFVENVDQYLAGRKVKDQVRLTDGY